MNWKKELGLRIRTIRQNLKLSQQKFGDSMGISSTAISAYEIGDATPPIDRIVCIAKLANVTLEWLLTGEDMLTATFDKYLPEDEKRLLAAYRLACQEDKLVILRVAENAAKLKKGGLYG